MNLLDVLLPGFLFGIGNAAHCAGMCGVFAVQAASGVGSARGAVRMGLYVGGKAFTYVFIGAIAGAVGHGVLGDTGTLRSVLGVVAGLALIGAGVTWLRPARGASKVGLAFTRAVGPLVQSIRKAGSVGGPFALGAATGFLPCGVVYLAALQGAAAASPLEGAAWMGAFGLGTVPVLAAVGLLGGRLVARLGGRRVRIAGGVLVILTGLFTVGRAALPWIVGTGDGGIPCCH